MYKKENFDLEHPGEHTNKKWEGYWSIGLGLTTLRREQRVVPRLMLFWRNRALMKRRALEGEGHEGCQVEAPAASAAMVAPLRRELSPSQLGL